MVDKATNNIDSQNDVKSVMTHVMSAFEQMVRTEMPDCAVIYDEQLSYETGLEALLTNNNFNGLSQRPNPMFIYNRTVLIDAENGLGNRARSIVGNINTSEGKALYSVTHGEFEIQFLYVNESVERTEQFEVVYMSDEGISGTKEITLTIPDLGEFKYFLTYMELTDKLIEHEDVYYKGIIGSIKVRGFYFTFRGSSKVIEQINQNIYASTNPKLKVKDEELSIKILE